MMDETLSLHNRFANFLNYDLFYWLNMMYRYMTYRFNVTVTYGFYMMDY
jgi:hypothetical protein